MICGGCWDNVLSEYTQNIKLIRTKCGLALKLESMETTS